jgi:FkbM family methyltransferase
VFQRLKQRLLRPFLVLSQEIDSNAARLESLRAALDEVKLALARDHENSVARDVELQARHTEMQVRDLEIQRRVADILALDLEIQGRAADILALDLEIRRRLADILALDLDIQQRLTTLLMRTPSTGKDGGDAFYRGLHAVGVLNYENHVVRGEQRFLTRFFERNPAAVVLDVGANVGQYSELARELAPAAVVHAFEPHPVSFAELTRVPSRIGVVAHPVALGDTNGEIDIFDYADEAGSQHASAYREVIEDVRKRPSAVWKVPCKTLDEMAAEMGLDRIGLLKIDTEGYELPVLKGARGLIAANVIDVIQFEFNEMNVVSRVFMKDFFALLPNYRIYRLLTDGVIEFEVYDPVFMEVFAFQNMACIRRDLDPSWIHGA